MPVRSCSATMKFMKSIEFKVERLAQVLAARKGVEIALRRYSAQNVDDHRSGFNVAHSFSGSCNNRSIALSSNPPTCPSLAR